MEGVGSFNIYKGKKVLVTGHTGFKGSWLTLWLTELGAQVSGYALAPSTDPALFDLLNLEEIIRHKVGDIREGEQLRKYVKDVKPDIIFHLAAQSLVLKSYDQPLDTVETNTLGTVNLLEAVRQTGITPAIVLITSDKCYENKEWHFGYRENDELGGHDPYSASKAAAEILIRSWRDSFFNPANLRVHGVRVASTRAGNVLGGGDWNLYNLVPDCIRDLQNERVIKIRNPYATRPWQHVLEPLSGYLQLGAKLLEHENNRVKEYCSAFNFGPLVTNNKNVKDLVEKIIENWGAGSWEWTSKEAAPFESSLLNLSIDKAHHLLQWFPKWSFDATICNTVEWYKKALHEPSLIVPFTIEQIRSYHKAKSISSPLVSSSLEII
jgi:CDP-glucose 4,6-dehydratase